jgi:hypothetical protein
LLYSESMNDQVTVPTDGFYRPNVPAADPYQAELEQADFENVQYDAPLNPNSPNFDPTQLTDEQIATYFPDYIKPQPEQIIMEWSAASRPFKKRDRQFYVTVAVIVFLICLILLFIRQFFPIAVVVSVAFLAYAIAAVPPSTSKFQITTYGLRIDSQLFSWEELGRFWIEEKYHIPVIYVETSRFPGRLTIMLGDMPEQEVTSVLAEVLLREKPLPSAMEKAATWIQTNIPLENS